MKYRCKFVNAATGEEIGWRGFLVPELARVLPFTGVALVSGLIWASWHYAITPVVYRSVGVPAWFWLPTFTFAAVAISFAQTWLRLKTGSVWPPRSAVTVALSGRDAPSL